MENNNLSERLSLRKKIADRIKLRRKLSGITQKEISNIIGCNTFTYVGYENCKSDVPISVLIRLADVYRTSIDYLTCRTDKHSIGKLSLKSNPLFISRECETEKTEEKTLITSSPASCFTCDYSIVLLDNVYCFSNPLCQGRKMHGKSCYPCDLYINSDDYINSPYLNRTESD